MAVLCFSVLYRFSETKHLNPSRRGDKLSEADDIVGIVCLVCLIIAWLLWAVLLVLNIVTRFIS
jgi:hypothetical protein